MLATGTSFASLINREVCFCSLGRQNMTDMRAFQSQDNHHSRLASVMLESPNSRIQRPPRRLTVNENPVIDAKPDTMRRVQRPIAPRKQQHRRHYSVPDNVLMNIASAAPEGGAHDNFKLYQPSLLRNTVDDLMNGGGDRHRQATDASIGNSFYMLSPSEATQGQTSTC